MKYLKNTLVSGVTALGVLAGVGAVSAPAQAQTAPVQCGTLAQLLVNGATCQVGDKIFSDFILIENTIDNDTTGRIEVDLNNIQVTGWNDDPYNPGLQFLSLGSGFNRGNGMELLELGIEQGPIINGTADLDLDFSFKVAVDPTSPYYIKDNSLVAFFDGSAPIPGSLRDHSAEVRERLFFDANLTQQIPDLDGVPIEKDVHREVDDSISLFSDESGVIVNREFAPIKELWVLKDIQITTSLQGEFAEIERFEQHFSQTTPEPGTVVGLLAVSGLGFAAKRKKQK